MHEPLPVPVPGGNDLSQRLDRRGGNWSYVSLSFAWHTPQFFSRLSQHPPVSFCVSPEVAGAGRGEDLRHEYDSWRP